jgi:hypothetical protein
MKLLFMLLFQPSVTISLSRPVIPVTTLRGLDSRGSIAGMNARFLSIPQCPDRLWGQPSFLSKGYRWVSRGCKRGLDWKLTAHLYLMPRSRMVEIYFHSPIRFYGGVLG